MIGLKIAATSLIWLLFTAFLIKVTDATDEMRGAGPVTSWQIFLILSFFISVVGVIAGIIISIWM